MKVERKIKWYRKGTVATIALFCTAAIMLSGCGNNSGTVQNAVKGSEEDLAYKASDEPLELTFFYGAGNYNKENPVFAEAARLTNITLKSTIPETTTDYQQAFNTMMASGEIDDVVVTTKANFDKYAYVHAFQPLDDLINQYAPHIKKYLDENPEIKKGMTCNDGHIYSLPRIETGETATGWYIRQDWLEKLNLSVPETVEEFYHVLTAFRNQDPNGNGEKDEIPFFDRTGSVGAIYNLYGVRNGFYIDDETNQIMYGAYTPEYKEAVKQVAKWYAEGLIDQEIFTRSADPRDQLLGENVGGSTHDWFTSTSSYTEKMKDKVPGISFTAIAPPADINGKVWEDRGRGTGIYTGWGISASNKHPEETIKFFDFWFTDSGNRLINFGIEGLQYNMVDGNPVFTEEFKKSSDKSMTTLFSENGMALYIGSVQDFDAERQFMSEDALKGMDMYTENNYIAKQMPELSFSEEERKTISDKLTAVQSYMAEKEQKWIMGVEDVEAGFDEYMENCKNLGIEDVLNVYNNAYHRQ